MIPCQSTECAMSGRVPVVAMKWQHHGAKGNTQYQQNRKSNVRT